MDCPNVPKGRALREDWACELCGRPASEHAHGAELVAELAALRAFRRSSLGALSDRAGESRRAACAAERSEPAPGPGVRTFPPGSLFHDPGPKPEEPSAHGRRRRS